MAKTNQGVEAIIFELERRLQKLKEQKARLGINTSPEILIEIEDIEAQLEELAQLKTQKIDDPFLAFILSLGIITADHISITLTINGVVVSGYITGAKQFGEYLLNNLLTGEGKIGVKPEVVDHSNKTYIHLRDARLYPTNGGPIPPLDKPGLYWRGKLSAVDSYAVEIIKSNE